MGGLVPPHDYGVVGRRVLVASATSLGEKMPLITRPQVSRVVRELLPQREWTREELIDWLHEMQERNERAKHSHIKRRAARQAMHFITPPPKPSL